MNIIGIGTAGCSAARLFEQYSQYAVYKVDSENLKEKKYYKIPKFKQPESYEQEQYTIPPFLAKIAGPTLVILNGASSEASSVLRLMQSCHSKCEITILYLQPELDLIGKNKALQEKVIRRVLQQYARSGVFERMLLARSSDIETTIGPTTIRNYFNKINEALVSTVHVINILEKSSPIYSTFSPIDDTARIATLGVFDISTGEEKSFFPIDKVSEVRYYYFINKKTIETDINFLSKTKDFIKSKGGVKSYAIYESDYENDYGYALFLSKDIQK